VHLSVRQKPNLSTNLNLNWWQFLVAGARNSGSDSKNNQPIFLSSRAQMKLLLALGETGIFILLVLFGIILFRSRMNSITNS
jgi:hypothetical protein